MLLKQTIEYIGENNSDQFLDVEFESYPEWESTGIGAYEYWGMKGFDAGQDYAVLNDYPTWNKDEYLFWENWIIAIYVVTEFKKLEQLFCAMLIEETIPDNY